MEDSSEDHWRDVDDNGEDNIEIHSLRWELYTKEKEEFINRELLCYFHI